MPSQIIYKGTVYKQAAPNKGVLKGIFNSVDKAWEWARAQIKNDRTVFVDAVGGQEGEYPMYSGDQGDVIKFHMKAGKGRSYKDLTQVTSKEDLIDAL